MDPDEGSAASNYLVDTGVDLAAYFNVLRLAEPSFLCQQQAPPPQQRYAPRTSDFSTAPTHSEYLLYQLQMAQQPWSPPPPQYYPRGESSSSSVCGLEIGAAASNLGPSAGSQPSMRTPSASASSYNPVAASRAPEAQQPHMLSASQYQSVTAFYPPVAPSPSVTSSSTSQYNTIAAYRAPEAQQPRTLSASQNQPVSAFFSTASPSPSVASSQLYLPIDIYYQCSDDNRQMLDVLRGTEPDFPPLMALTIVPQARTLEETRLELLSGPMDQLPLALFTESSDHVVTLLKEDNYEIRLSVLAGVKSHVHKLIDSNEGHKVFVALLRCCQGVLQDLHGIVEAAVMPIGNATTSCLLQSAKQDHGENCIKALISAVARYPQLRQLITDCFVVERITEHPRGEQLLHHFFNTMPYLDSMVLIRYACSQTGYMCSSAFGSRCLAECFLNAQGTERQYLEKYLVGRFHDIARGQYSNYFVQRVLECGRMGIKQRIVCLIVEDVVSLSQHQYGSYVVEASFLKAGQLHDLCTHHILLKFVHLTDDMLVELVYGGFSNFVVQKLLIAGKDLYPTESLTLARKIERLVPQTVDDQHARQVVKVIKRLFYRSQMY